MSDSPVPVTNAFESDVVLANIKQTLSQISPRHQCAFAASCAARMLELYQKYSEGESWSNIDLMRNSVEAVKSFLESGWPSARDMTLVLDACNKHIPDLEDSESEFADCAQSAAIVVACAVESVNEALSAKAAVGACVEAIDAVLTEATLLSIPRNHIIIQSAQDSEIAAGDPRVLAEISKQAESLRTLASDPELKIETLGKLW